MKKVILLLCLLFPYSVYADELISHADSGILIEANSGKILFEKEKDKELSVASMTKMMAQIIIMEEIEKGRIHWDDIVTASHNASSMGGSQIYLEAGEKMSVEDLMKGISVASGNDATVAMAEYISGTEEKFVQLMNQKVKKLGLKHTHFMNATGLDEKDHYSSSYDMAVIARELVLNHPNILKYSSIYEDYLRENTDHKFWLVNTNKLISQYEGTDGLKTGHTDDAGYCLAATTKRDNLRLIAIVLGEEDSKIRNKETMELLDYGFSNVKMKELKKKGDIIKSISFPKANIEKANVILKESLNVIEEVGDVGDYQYKIELNHLKLPIEKNEVVGKIIVLENNKELSSGELVLEEEIKPLSLWNLFTYQLFHILYGIY